MAVGEEEAIYMCNVTYFVHRHCRIFQKHLPSLKSCNR